MTDTIHVRGEGGGIFEFGLPLSRHIQERLDTHQLTRVNADGSTYVADTVAVDLDEVVDETLPIGEGRPLRTASKAEWVEFAVSRGADRSTAELLTKTQLVMRFGNG